MHLYIHADESFSIRPSQYETLINFLESGSHKRLVLYTTNMTLSLENSSTLHFLVKTIFFKGFSYRFWPGSQIVDLVRILCVFFYIPNLYFPLKLFFLAGKGMATDYKHRHTAWGVQRGRRWPQAVCCRPAHGPPLKQP
jgi:hypothetical protein